MLQTKIFIEKWEIDYRLSLLGVTKAELMTVVEMAVGARADAVPHDPITAPGLLSYIYGTRGIRDIFASKGWIKDSCEGIESTYDPVTGTKVIFQNTDSACDAWHPKAIAGKGLASQRVVELANRYLWPEMEEERLRRLNGPVWYFCLYVNGDDVRAELSRPLAINGGQFSEFIERIFILKHREWNPITPSKVDDHPLFQDFDIPVTRK